MHVNYFVGRSGPEPGVYLPIGRSLRYKLVIVGRTDYPVFNLWKRGMYVDRQRASCSECSHRGMILTGHMAHTEHYIIEVKIASLSNILGCYYPRLAGGIIRIDLGDILCFLEVAIYEKHHVIHIVITEILYTHNEIAPPPKG